MALRRVVLATLAIVTSIAIAVTASRPASAGDAPLSRIFSPPTAGRDFGERIEALVSGNVVVIDPSDAATPGVPRGALHLFDGETGELINSTFNVGFPEVFPLPDGDFIVAFTVGERPDHRVLLSRCDGRIGCPAAFDETNSLVTNLFSPSNASLVSLVGGGWAMAIPDWFTSTGSIVGAAIACPATGRCTGQGGDAAVIVGTGTGIGTKVEALPDGGYVVAMPFWGEGALTAVGAVVRCPAHGCTGVVSPSNSLRGSVRSGNLGRDVAVLPSGNVVITGFGVSVWCDRNESCIGETDTMANSVQLPGQWADVTVLPNGKYVLSSGQVWCPDGPDCATHGRFRSDVAARMEVLTDGNYVVYARGLHHVVEWCHGESGCGPVPDPAHTIGGDPQDLVPLVGGGYALSLPGWSDLSGRRGAVVVCPRFGCASPIDPTDMIIGPTDTSQVGSGGLFALPNGGLVISSPHWTDGSEPDLGAVMWCGPDDPCSGVMTRDRVLSGKHLLGDVTVLRDGSYVVTSPLRALGPRGARWCPADMPCTGDVTDRNGLIFDRGTESAGIDIWPISNGTYIVSGYQPATGLFGCCEDTYVVDKSSVVGRTSTVMSDQQGLVTNVVVEPISGSAWVRIRDGGVQRWSPKSVVPSPGYTPMTPARLVDTRNAPDVSTVDFQWAHLGPIAAGGVLEFRVAGRAGIDARTKAVSLNVTVTEPSNNGFVTMWPCGERPNSSSLNFAPGQTVANAVTVGLSPVGTVCAFASASTHLVVDVTGAYGTGAEFVPVPPGRLVETRTGAGLGTIDRRFQGSGRLRAGTVFAFDVVGRAGLPADESAVVLNVTATDSQGPGFVTVWPCGVSRPNSSNLNTSAGSTVATSVTVQLGANGQVCAFSSVDTHLVVDANGALSASSTYQAVVPARLLETRTGVGLSTIDGRSQGVGAVPTGGTIRVAVAGRAGVSNDATAAVLTLTATESSAAGFVTIWPCNVDRPVASVLNTSPNRSVANSATTRLPAGGEVCIFTSTETHLVVDVSGFHTSVAPSAR